MTDRARQSLAPSAERARDALAEALEAVDTRLTTQVNADRVLAALPPDVALVSEDRLSAAMDEADIPDGRTPLNRWSAASYRNPITNQVIHDGLRQKQASAIFRAIRSQQQSLSAPAEPESEAKP